MNAIVFHVIGWRAHRGPLSRQRE